MKPSGHFLRNGERHDAWGTNLSRALWYSSKGSGGSAKEGRMRIDEFKRFVDEIRPGILDSGRNGWAARSWDVKLPNGVTLAFSDESA